MTGTSKREITRDIHGAIRLITNAPTTALVSPTDHAFRANGCVCPLVYVAQGFQTDRVTACHMMFKGDSNCPDLGGYLVWLYDSSKSKIAGKRAVVRFLKLYRDDQLAAQREAIQFYNPTVSFEPLPTP